MEIFAYTVIVAHRRGSRTSSVLATRPTPGALTHLSQLVPETNGKNVGGGDAVIDAKAPGPVCEFGALRMQLGVYMTKIIAFDQASLPRPTAVL